METQLVTAFEEVVSSYPTLAILSLILINLALGVVNALKDGRFTLYEMGDIMKKVLPLLLGYFTLATTGRVIGGTAGTLTEFLAPILGGAPFVASSLKELKGVGVPLEKVIGTALVNVLASKPVADEGALFEAVNSIHKRFISSSITASQALAEGEAVFNAYKARTGKDAPEFLLQPFKSG